MHGPRPGLCSTKFVISQLRSWTGASWRAHARSSPSPVHTGSLLLFRGWLYLVDLMRPMAPRPRSRVRRHVLREATALEAVSTSGLRIDGSADRNRRRVLRVLGGAAWCRQPNRARGWPGGPGLGSPAVVVSLASGDAPLAIRAARSSRRPLASSMVWLSRGRSRVCELSDLAAAPGTSPDSSESKIAEPLVGARRWPPPGWSPGCRRNRRSRRGLQPGRWRAPG